MKVTKKENTMTGVGASTLPSVAEEDREDNTQLVVGAKQSVVLAETGVGGKGAEHPGVTNCFGVKSYLHHFYDSKGEMPTGIYEDLTQEDDFEYLVEPGKRRARWCYWFKWCIWCGANLLLIGIITLLVGHLTPKRDVVVDFHDHLEILDRWAITFNQRLEFCRIAGLVIFLFGGMIVFTALLVSTCVPGNNHGDACCCYDVSYGDVSTTTATTTTTRLIEPYKEDGKPVDKIPITEQIQQVQPQGEGVAVEKKGDGSVSVQIPYY